MKKLFIFSLYFILTVNYVLISQTTNINTNLQTIRIKAKREVYDPAATSLNTTIITSEEIKSMGANTVAEAIKYFTGVQTTSRLQSRIVYMRGVNADRVVVLINGQRLNIAQGSAGDGVDLSIYGIANVERIEIIRGAAATRYGGDAIGGVINIITKERAYNTDGVDVVLKYGSYNTMLANAIISKSFGTNNNGNIVIDGGIYYSKGDYNYSFLNNKGENIEGRMQNNDMLRGNARVGLGYKLNSYGDSIYFSMSALNEEHGVPGRYYNTNSAYNFSKARYNMQKYLSDISYENYSIEYFNLFIRANTLYQVREYDAKKDTYPDYSKYDNVATELAINIDREDDFGGSIFNWYNNIEVSYKNDWFKSNPPRKDVFVGSGKQAQRNTASISYTPVFGFFRYDETDVNRFEISPAVRFDAVIGSGALTNRNFYEPTYSVGIMYTFDKERKYTLKGNFAIAYRLPNFDDMYTPYSVNTDLKKESSIGGDIGFIIEPISMVRLETSYYINSVTNMISWAPDTSDPTGYIWRPYNVDSAILQGVEANLFIDIPINIVLSSIELKANYIYQFGRGNTPDLKNKKLAHIPENQFNTMISYIYEGDDMFSGRLNFLVNYTGERYNDLPNTIKLKDYTTFDITASLTFLKFITIEGGVKNVMNIRYEDIYGYPLAGREWYISALGRF